MSAEDKDARRLQRDKVKQEVAQYVINVRNDPAFDKWVDELNEKVTDIANFEITAPGEFEGLTINEAREQLLDPKELTNLQEQLQSETDENQRQILESKLKYLQIDNAEALQRLERILKRYHLDEYNAWRELQRTATTKDKLEDTIDEVSGAPTGGTSEEYAGYLEKKREIKEYIDKEVIFKNKLEEFGEAYSGIEENIDQTERDFARTHDPDKEETLQDKLDYLNVSKNKLKKKIEEYSEHLKAIVEMRNDLEEELDNLTGSPTKKDKADMGIEMKTKQSQKAPGKDDKKDYDHKEHRTQPAKSQMKFEITRMFSTTSSDDNGYIIFDIAWNPDTFKSMSEGNVQHQIISFIKGLESDKFMHDFGIMGKPKFVELDIDAGVARIKVRSSETRGVMTMTLPSEEMVVPVKGIY